MSKVTLELNDKEIEKLVEKLPMEDKVRIARRLSKETIRARWNKILQNIDERRKKYPITEEEITKEIEAVRREIYAKSRR